MTQLMTQTIPTLRTYRDSLKIDWSLQAHSDNDSDRESELEEEIEADENLDDEEVTEILHSLLREAAEPGAQDPVKNQVSMLERLVTDRGHHITIFLLKFHCELNPIEIVSHPIY
jgi:hypothetical protein